MGKERIIQSDQMVANKQWENVKRCSGNLFENSHYYLFSFGNASGAEIKQLHMRSKSIYVFNLCYCT